MDILLVTVVTLEPDCPVSGTHVSLEQAGKHKLLVTLIASVRCFIIKIVFSRQVNVERLTIGKPQFT